MLWRYLGVLICVITIPGCARFTQWAHTQFHQGYEINYDLEIIDRYMRSVSIYHGIDTRGIFDVLWLGDEVRWLYTVVYSDHHAKTEQQERLFLRRQLEENEHAITFYMTALYGTALEDAATAWALILRVNDKEYRPRSIALLDPVEPEYRLFFGKKMTRFKQMYKIVFDTLDPSGAKIITPDTKSMRLIMHTLTIEDCVEWYFDDDGCAIGVPIGWRRTRRAAL